MKALVGVDTLYPTSIDRLDIKLAEAIHVSEHTFFLDLFEKFKEEKSRMAFMHQEYKDEKLLPDDKMDDDKKIEDKNKIVIENKKENEEKKENNNIVEVNEPLLNDNKEDEKKMKKKKMSQKKMRKK